MTQQQKLICWRCQGNNLDTLDNCVRCGTDENVGLAPNTVIPGGYRIVDYIARGGMGHVYGAIKQGQQYAVKHFAYVGPRNRYQAAKSLFQREGQLHQQLNDPNIVRCFEAIEEDDELFIVMERVDGQTLATILGDQPTNTLDILTALDYVIQLCGAFRAMHAKGIIHRDGKPENMIIVDNGTTVKLTDLGVAKDISDFSQTQVSFGSIGYEAPEQRHRNLAQPGPYTDAYAAGAVLARILMGEQLPTIGSGPQIFHNRVQYVGTKITESDIVGIIRKAIAYDHTQRYQTMDAMIADLVAAYTWRARLPQLLAAIVSRTSRPQQRPQVHVTGGDPNTSSINPQPTNPGRQPAIRIQNPTGTRTGQQPPIQTQRPAVTGHQLNNPAPNPGLQTGQRTGTHGMRFIQPQQPGGPTVNNNPTGQVRTGQQGGGQANTGNLPSIPQHSLEKFGPWISWGVFLAGGLGAVMSITNLPGFLFFFTVAIISANCVALLRNGQLVEVAQNGTEMEVVPGAIRKMTLPIFSIPMLIIIVMLAWGSTSKPESKTTKPDLKPISSSTLRPASSPE